MREKKLKSLDHVIMAALLLAVPTAWLLCRIFRRKRSGIALIRPGGMGDLICLEMAMKHAPIASSEITYFIDARSAAWASYRQLRAVRYDIKTIYVLLKNAGRFKSIVVSEQLFGSAAAFGLLLAGGERSRVYGFSTQRGRIALGKTIDYSPIEQHEVSCFARLLNLAAGNHNPAEVSEAELLRTRIYAAESNDLWVSIAGRGVPSRELSLARFTEIIQNTANGRKIVVTAQPSDTSYAEELVSALGDASLFKGNFKDMCDSLARAEEVLTIDGGMVHVCSFFGVRTRVLFTAGVQEKWRPLAKNSQIAVAPGHLPCRPCTRFGQVPACPIDYACKAFPVDVFPRHAH